MNITLENISHKITDINIDENGLVTGSITLLNTPKGKIAQAIVEGGLPLFISSRATGAVDSKTGNVTLEKISTYDLVGSPGFSQARLKLNENQVAESINESAIYYITEKENEEDNLNENNEDMELKEILEKIENMQARIESLETENEELREALEAQEPQFNLEALANGIQKWMVEQYSPKLQEWIVEHCLADTKEEILEEAADNMQETLREEIVENIAPVVQNWVVGEVCQGIQNWAVTEFAPGIQDWMINEYTPNVENWLNESFAEKMAEKTHAIVAESKKSSLSAIDQTLQILEGMETMKPTYSRKALITENANEPKFIAEMPADVRVKWDLASNEVKESIQRRAKLYNFLNEGAVERFWNSINFEEVKPVQNIYEGLDTIQDERERAIRARIRAGRFNRMG